ncbi:MAG: phosphate acyltransferase PlsX [Azoarcus sp.]|jgi:glycerol-3-phosphate acyltransferase PlsX|nr:phosphate acyltransferase PlsX [Azoarcus sp.]
MSVTIAVDCMGGDHGPSVTVPASLAFLRDHPAANAVLVGREDVLRPLAGETAAGFGTRLRIHNATQVIGMDEPLVSAMRTKKDSSMRVAAELVKAGQAQAAVSAGNTGALVAVSRFVLKMLPGIDRPAICFALPTVEGHTYALDLGANVDCTAEHLLQFGIMGTVLASVLDHSERPSVGLLNVGAEEIKGNEVAKKATELLRASNLNFYGNVEGDDIYKGVTDVVVCDGFVGNVALKTTEGLARMMATFLREEFERGPLSLLMGAVARPVLKRFKRRADPRRYNGAVLLGLRGIVVKSHGSADILSFEQALARAADAAGDRLVERIGDRVAAITGANGGQDA